MTPPARFGLGLVQMRCAADPEANLAAATARVREAAARGARLVCLPELFRTRYFCQRQDAATFDLAEPVPGPTTDALARLARELAIVVVGSVFERRAAGGEGGARRDAAGRVADGAARGRDRQRRLRRGREPRRPRGACGRRPRVLGSVVRLRSVRRRPRRGIAEHRGDPRRRVRPRPPGGRPAELALPARSTHRRLRRDHQAAARRMSEAATPAALGYRMPAEWEPLASTWLAWPHERRDRL